jgi:deazaflavin-dependent oxidoreductase (nitroreductase family)
VRKNKNQENYMTEMFHMTSSMRIGSAMLTALLRAGLPLGSLTLLSVRGRKSGKVHTTPVALVEQDGTSFLVAAFGEVSWVHNLRAAGSAQLTRGRRTEGIEVVELEVREAAPILKQFLTSYHMVPFIPPYFDVTPRSPLADFEREATRHPVFRLVKVNRTQEKRGHHETHPGW